MVLCGLHQKQNRCTMHRLLAFINKCMWVWRKSFFGKVKFNFKYLHISIMKICIENVLKNQKLSWEKNIIEIKKKITIYQDIQRIKHLGIPNWNLTNCRNSHPYQRTWARFGMGLLCNRRLTKSPLQKLISNSKTKKIVVRGFRCGLSYKFQYTIFKI